MRMPQLDHRPGQVPFFVDTSPLSLTQRLSELSCDGTCSRDETTDLQPDESVFSVHHQGPSVETALTWSPTHVRFLAAPRLQTFAPPTPHAVSSRAVRSRQAPHHTCVVLAAHHGPSAVRNCAKTSRGRAFACCARDRAPSLSCFAPSSHAWAQMILPHPASRIVPAMPVVWDRVASHPAGWPVVPLEVP